jgi:hypothetical protein
MGETEFCEASDYSDFLANEQILVGVRCRTNRTPLSQRRGTEHEKL